jgi:hypothetical protein
MGNEKAELGFAVIPEEISATHIAKVRSAAQSAGLDAESIRDIRPRNAFIRAMRDLQKAGIIEEGTDGVLRDKFCDDDESVVFQFSRKYVESQGVTYQKEAVIRFIKNPGLIECSNPEYKALAEDLYVKAHGVYSVTDLNAYVARVIKSECHRVPLKDGVYFISHQHGGLLEKLKKFYAELNFTLHVFSVGHGGTHPKDIFKAVLRDLQNQMQSTTDEIGTLKAGNDLTPKIAKNRLKELRKQLDQYKEIAGALRVDLDTMLVQAGDAGKALAQVAQPVDSLIQLIQSGRIDTTLGELLVSAGEIPVTALPQIRTRPALQVDVAGEVSDSAHPVLVLGRSVKPVTVDV